MRKNTLSFLILIILLLLAFALGALLAGRRGPSAQYRREMESLNLETATKMRTIKVSFWGGLAAVVVFGAAGLVAALLRTAWQRSRLVHPHENGLFPLVQGRAGGQTYYHDPNRQLSGSVAYGAESEGVTVQHLMPPNDQGEQLQVTSQAQAAQLVAAAGQGRGLTAQSRQLVERVASAAATRSVPRLPDVVVLDESIPEERHLLTALRTDWDE
jgi:hypothetical protein